MQTFEFGLACPECSKALIDAGEELACPSCGIVSDKEVIETKGSAVTSAVDFTKFALGSYMGSQSISVRERYSKGFSKSNSTYRYLKVVSDYVGRDDGPAYECAKLLERVSEKLGLPKVVAGHSVILARRLLESREANRRITIATVSAYALIVACKTERVVAVSTNDVLRTFRSLGRRVKLSSIIRISLDSQLRTEARRPEEYLAKVLAKLSLNSDLSAGLASAGIRAAAYFNSLRVTAIEVLGRVGPGLKEGHRPFALAATAVYAADLLMARRESRRRLLTQRDVAECGDTAEYTVREQYRQIFAPSLIEPKSGPRQNCSPPIAR